MKGSLEGASGEHSLMLTMLTFISESASIN
jgi:hypothetical protein